MLFLNLYLAPSMAWAQAQIPSDVGQLRLSFAPVVARVGPAVVNVYSKRIERRQSQSPFFNDPFFKRFFGRSFGAPRERVSNSLGSGAIVSPDGIVVTNHHVIGNGGEIRIALADKREFVAKVLAKDERTDLAILKIISDGEVFPYLDFADSDVVEIGDLVLAVGNPFGIGQTVTSGIVSALARTQVGISDFRFFIQTDAAINPGNSGGPLIDIHGRVIGINTAIFSRSGGSLGIGFAIPSNMARIVVDTAVSGKRLRRPWVGGRFQALTVDLAHSLGVDRPVGALVTEVYANAPLDQAGILPGDIILQVDEFDIDDPQGLIYRLTTHGIGGGVGVVFRRGDKRISTQLALRPAPEVPPRHEKTLSGTHELSGARVANLSPAVAEELDLEIKFKTRAVVVTKIESGSHAERVRLKVGDIILGINGRRTRSVVKLERALGRIDGVFDLTIRRGNKVISSELGG